MSAVLASKMILVLICGLAIWLDVTIRKLPNWLALSTLAAGLAATAIIAGPSALGSHIIHVLIALFGGVALFALRMVGGGDAKLYAAVASWFALRYSAALLVSVALCGLVLFFGWFVWRRASGKKIRAPASQSDDDKLPYGVAIALGATLLYWQTGA